ncbi:MAG: sigma-54 dependent transcriptional regulator [bacterium]
MNILVVDDEEKMCKILKMMLEKNGHKVETAYNGTQSLEKITKLKFDLVITDFKMPDMNGLVLLEKIKQYDYSIDIIIMTAYASVTNAVDAMKKGAYDYIIKPFPLDELEFKIKKIEERKKNLFKNEKNKSDTVIGTSSSIKKVFEMVSKVIDTDTTVLLRGESGTGKEIIARNIHYNSKRKDKPFIDVSCAALPETLLESELFGYEKGAFTGANETKKGRFELAQEGTIFLDEIGEISLGIQVKLLRILQQREFVRLGGITTIKTDVRIITATNKNLENAIKQNLFREDLYYRLNVFPIFLPSLKERKEDIPELVFHFLSKLNQPSSKITCEALNCLINYHWPGNIRELENIIERATILAGESLITLDHFPLYIQNKFIENSDTAHSQEISLEELEKNFIFKTIENAKGNKSKAANLLGITRRSLYSKLEKLKKELK